VPGRTSFTATLSPFFVIAASGAVIARTAALLAGVPASRGPRPAMSAASPGIGRNHSVISVTCASSFSRTRVDSVTGIPAIVAS
jgi:hypothetical protein